MRSRSDALLCRNSSLCAVWDLCGLNPVFKYKDTCTVKWLTEPMPQESGTAEMLIDAGLAKPIYYASDIVGIVESLEHIDNRDKLPLPKMHNLDRTDAVYEIAKIILSNCHTKYEPNKFKEVA